MTPPLVRSIAAFPRSAAYSRYAEVYDEIGQRTFGERIAEATLAHLREAGFRPASVADLACGTGSATLIFAASGMRVTGIDASPAMLARAAAAAEAVGLPVTWSEQDMRSFRLPAPVELVTCFYDAVNYLIETDDLTRLFASAHAALEPGGRIVFDVNTREKFSSSWSESCVIAVDRDDLFGLYQSWYQPDTGLSPLTLTFFVRDAAGRWDRFDEEHVERAYPLDQIAQLLAGAGFDLCAMLDYKDRLPRFGGPATERSHRAVFIAERRA